MAAPSASAKRFPRFQRLGILAAMAFSLIIVNIAFQGKEYTHDGLRRTESTSTKEVVATTTMDEVNSNNKLLDPSRVCVENPYKGALNSSLEEIAERMDTWMGDLSKHRAKADNRTAMGKHDHNRFFPFQIMTTCNEKSCVGGRCGRDTSKIVCGLQELQKEDDKCIIYSVGGNNQWQFELDVLKRTPCEVHTFDCTGNKTRFQKPENDRLYFHHVCLGTLHEDVPPEDQCAGLNKCGATWTLAEMQQKLHHKRIDLFKIDIEGFEWPLLESWPQIADPGASKLVLPMQILMEVHYRTGFVNQLHPFLMGNHRWDYYWARDMVNLQTHLLRMGYVVWDHDDNNRCPHCTELSLVRIRCQESGSSDDRGAALVQAS